MVKHLSSSKIFSLIIINFVSHSITTEMNHFICRLPTGSKLLERGMEKRLVIDNVTYDYQGEYECHATNYINGQERTVTSSPVSLQVVGKLPKRVHTNIFPLLFTIFNYFILIMLFGSWTTPCWEGSTCLHKCFKDAFRDERVGLISPLHRKNAVISRSRFYKGNST